MNEITEQSILEDVVIRGDLSKLSPEQRVQYYRMTCESLGLNPLTRPFDYIMLNGKLVLYAKKDATDQLRAKKGISIDDIDLKETEDTFVVKVKGHDASGRSDVEIGVVRKSDMQGNLANSQMKAVTKAKRRLTLSLCGLGWLDETEVETIPSAKPVIVSDTGEIIDDKKSLPEQLPKADDDRQFLAQFKPIGDFHADTYPIEKANLMESANGKPFSTYDTKALMVWLTKALSAYEKTPEGEKKTKLGAEITAVQAILLDRKSKITE